MSKEVAELHGKRSLVDEWFETSRQKSSFMIGIPLFSCMADNSEFMRALLPLVREDVMYRHWMAVRASKLRWAIIVSGCSKLMMISFAVDLEVMEFVWKHYVAP